MSAYKNKHLHQLRNIGVAIIAAHTLSACSGHSNQDKKTQEYGMLAKDSIEKRDLYGNEVVLKKVEFSVYRDAEMTPRKISQILWGTPKEELPKVYHGEPTYVVNVYLNHKDEDMGYVEVFKNSDGVVILKDQPCFAVGTDSRLLYIGDAKNYSQNLSKYRDYLYAKQEAANTQVMHAEQKTFANKDDLVELKDSIEDTIMPDTLYYEADSVLSNKISVDSLLININQKTKE